MKLLALCSCLLACGASPNTGPNDTPGPEMDATIDHMATDATPDAKVADAAADADAAWTMDASQDSDAGSPCPPCVKNDDLCCTVKSSMNYGKCVSGACLSCCQ